MIAVRCAKCEGEFEVADGYAGQRVECRRCGRLIGVGRQLAPTRAGDASPGVHIPEAGSDDTGPLIKFRCVHCCRKHGVGERYAGKVIRCSDCRKPVRVPYGGESRSSAFADEDEASSDGPVLAELPSTEPYERRQWERRVLPRVITTAIVAAALIVGAIFAAWWAGEHVENRRLAAAEQQVTALIEQAEEALAEQDLRAARGLLDDAWAAIEESGVPPFRTRELERRLASARAALAEAQGGVIVDRAEP